MRILILNGPNLNRLGTREPETYGFTSAANLERVLVASFPEIDIEFAQSNVEGELINHLQLADSEGMDGVVFNPGGYTHTSVALRDAVASVAIPVVEVHITNLSERESFRHESLIAPKCIGHVSGFGLDSYRLGIHALILRRSS